MDEEAPIEITLGEPTYAVPAERFRYEVLPGAREVIAKKADEPSSIEKAFLYRMVLGSAYFTDTDYADFLMEACGGSFDKNKKWRGESDGELAEALERMIEKGEYETIEIKKKSAEAEAGMGLVDKKDKKNIQIVVSRDRGGNPGNVDSYMFLVVYPPEEANGEVIRKSEVSFPTAECHLVGAKALLDESLAARILDRRGRKNIHSPKRVKTGFGEYKMRVLKVSPVSDRELLEVVTTHGRTSADKVIQAGLKVVDRIKERRGEHIDPLSAFRDQEYATAYVLACHKGVGAVVNEKINLPPVVS